MAGHARRRRNPRHRNPRPPTAPLPRRQHRRQKLPPQTNGSPGQQPMTQTSCGKLDVPQPRETGRPLTVEGTDFIYLGSPTPSNAEQTTMPGADGQPLQVVTMHLELEQAVDRATFDYLVS